MVLHQAYQINDEQAAVFLAALIIENGKTSNGEPLRVSYDSIRKASQAIGIKARDLFHGEAHDVELKLVS